jgi:hypothetical protein
MNQTVYLTPFKEALQWAGQNLSDAAFKTFLMEFSHVDSYGYCFAGFRRLGELGRHDLTCIYYEMQEIMACGLVRLVEESKRDRYGRWTPALYQVNPYFLYLRPDCFDEALERWNAIEQTVEQKVPVFGLTSIVSIESTESAPTKNTNKQHHQATPENSSSSSKNPLNPEMPNAGEIAKWQRLQQQSEATDSRAKRPTQKTGVPPPPPEKYPAITPVPRALSLDHEEELALKIASGIDMAIRLVRGLITMYGYNAVATAYNDPFVATADKPGGALRSVLQKQQKVEPLEVSTDEQLQSYEQTQADLMKRWHAEQESEIRI